MEIVVGRTATNLFQSIFMSHAPAMRGWKYPMTMSRKVQRDDGSVSPDALTH